MNLKYVRPTSPYQESRENSIERTKFENDVLDAFIKLYASTENLNIKVHRNLFSELLNEIGVVIQKFAKKAASSPQDFEALNEILTNNPVPQIASGILTDEFRLFCLSLNAVKQFVSAEQTATDRVLLGGQFKKKIKNRFDTCSVSKQKLIYHEKGKVNFHHTMRDGRFPIPLTKDAHNRIEAQVKCKKK